MPAGQATPDANELRTRRFLIGIGAAIFLAVLVAIVASSGGGPEEDPPHLDMDPEVIESEKKRARADMGLQAELDELEQKIRGGGGGVRGRLGRITRDWPGSPRAHYLLGLAFLDVRYWRDGFQSLRRAIRLDPSLRSDPELIKGALRSLTSKSKPELGVRFLVDDIGEAAIPYLEETAKGGSEQQREHAARALDELGAR